LSDWDVNYAEAFCQLENFIYGSTIESHSMWQFLLAVIKSYTIKFFLSFFIYSINTENLFSWYMVSMLFLIISCLFSVWWPK